MTELQQMNGAPVTIMPQEGPSNIQTFYSGSSIFITGASGFLGHLLLEKLLRTCPDLTQIYLLLREKKGKNIKERLDALFDTEAFERLRLEQPKFIEKVSVMTGDCELANMGLSDIDLDIIRSRVDIVFHVAATVRFTERLRKAVSINVKCTKDLLCLAKTMSKLKVYLKWLNLLFTLFCNKYFFNCVQPEVKEEFYEVPITCDKLIDICDTLDDSQLDTLTPQLLGKWPNTYSYTKAIAEYAVRTYGQMLPVTIVRPSIVLSTAKEPIPGWVTNIMSATGVFIDFGLGILHVMPGDDNNLADLVPADYCINSTIAAAWQVGTVNDQLNESFANDADNFKDIVNDENIPIYNYVSSPEKPITWPAVADGACVCVGRKPVMVKAYNKLHALTNSLNYFTSRQWIFQNKNTQALWKTLSERDRDLFEFNMAAFDWSTYIWSFCKGARIYVLKDPLDTVGQAKAKTFKFRIAHYCIVFIVSVALIKFAVLVLGYLLSTLY